MKKSILLFVAICFGLFLNAQSSIENPGFEDWEEVGLGPDIIEPVDWSTIKTSDDPAISGLTPITWEKSTDAHSGQYCLKLYNTSTLGIPVVGTICNGQYHANLNTDLAWSFTNLTDPQWHTPFTARPDSIAFWLKFFPMEGDTLQFQALLHVGDATIPPKPENIDNQVAYTRADLPGTYENWTRIALAFDYYDNRTPEYIFMILTSGNGTTSIDGSVAYYDDLEVIGGDLAINDNPLDQIEIYATGNTLYIKNLSEGLMKNASVEIIDLVGRSVAKNKIQSKKVQLDPRYDLNGMYIVKITSDDYVVSRKIYIN